MELVAQQTLLEEIETWRQDNDFHSVIAQFFGLLGSKSKSSVFPWSSVLSVCWAEAGGGRREGGSARRPLPSLLAAVDGVVLMY